MKKIRHSILTSFTFLVFALTATASDTTPNADFLYNEKRVAELEDRVYQIADMNFSNMDKEEQQTIKTELKEIKKELKQVSLDREVSISVGAIIIILLLLIIIL